MDLKSAVSLGLIVNELVTDCLKHAFPGERKGMIGIGSTGSGTRTTFRVPSMFERPRT
jgi:two-component sensor histidine kinase